LDDQTFNVNLIENLTSEYNEEIELETECEFELESENFNLDQIVDYSVHWASTPILLNPEPRNLTPPSTETSPPLELKTLPNHVKYIYLGGKETLPIIIVSYLIEGQEESLLSVLRKHREVIG